MAVIAPQTDVYLLKVPLEIDEINQLTFSNATAQYNYFNSLPKLGFDKFTYQRKDGTLRLPALIDDIISYNYVMYRNTAYSNKWFYAFITGMEYLNDSVTAVSIKTDVWMTWEFDLTFKPTLIDREHTNDDTVGKNTLPEGLELGEFVVNGDTENFGAMSGLTDFVTVIDVTMVENPGANQTLSWNFDVSPAPVPTFSPIVNGTPSATVHLLLGYNQYNQRVSGYYDPNVVIDVFNNAGLSDAIVNAYIMPESMVNTNYIYGGFNLVSNYTDAGGTTITKTASNLAIFAQSNTETSLGNKTFAKPTTLDGYTPKNGKLKCFPFTYFNVSNNAGSSYQYRYEDFSSNVTFNLEGAFCASCSIKAIPQNYKNIDSNENAYDYSVNAAKLPILSWSSDSYTNWLTQNSVNMRMERQNVVRQAIGEALGGAMQFGAPGFALGAGTLIGGSFANAREEFKAKSNANLSPDQVHGNLNAGDLLWAKYRSNFTYLPMSIKAEYAKCCDEFLSTYGYKTNRVKVPNITGRRNWNYVKTVGCYIEADIPQDDLQEIKSMFDKGITFWHNPATFGDYSQNNDII